VDPRANRPPATPQPIAAATSYSARPRALLQSGRSRSLRPRSHPPPRSPSPSTSFTPYPTARRPSERTSFSPPPRPTRQTPYTAATARSSSTATPTATPPTSGCPSSTTRRRHCSSPLVRTRSHRRSSGRPMRRCAGFQARSPASTRIRVRPHGLHRHGRSTARRVHIRRRRPSALRGAALRPRAAYVTPRHVPQAPRPSRLPARGREPGRDGRRRERPAIASTQARRVVTLAMCRIAARHCD
jgi:hypothetical protein